MNQSLNYKMDNIEVIKYSGERELFDVSLLKKSLLKSGATNEEVKNVLDKIQASVYDGITTWKLYDLAFDALKEQKNSYAARYSLKKALRDLGPTGFIFERWIAKVLEAMGLKVITNQVLQGHSVSHEVDVVAQSADKDFLIECKFRNVDNAKVNVKDPMYFLSRFYDLKGLSFSIQQSQVSFTIPWMITNGQFTSDAIDFSEYHHVKLLGWDYPKGKSIKSLVDEMLLYPVTCLTTLTDEEKNKLLKKDCILVKDLKKNSHYLESLKLSEAQISIINQEICELINEQNA